MKVQLEEIRTTDNSSFRILVNPNLSDFFYWHFHPELELVFIDGTSGNRHVGDHISTFQNRDLVLIGSNIPHLNFDYGVKGSYEKIVLHFRPDFLESSFENTPELADIKMLFERANHGVCFGERTMELVSDRIMHLHKMNDFELFLEVLNIFQALSKASDQSMLHDHPVPKRHGLKDKRRLDQIYQFVDTNYHRKMELYEVAAISNLTKEAFCRYFKKMTKLTFTQFVNHYRIDVAKKLLLQGSQITDTCFDCGFDSISYFNRVFKKITGTNPKSFKKEYLS